MEDLKYNILEKINYLNLYHKKRVEAIRKKRWFQIAFGVVMILIGIFSKAGEIQILSKKPKLFDEVLIFTGVVLIVASIWVITRKREDYPTKNLDCLTHEIGRAHV